MAKQETYSYHELYKKAKEKEDSHNRAENDLKNATDFSSILTVDVDEQTNLMDYYSSRIPGLKFDQDVSAFWGFQKNEISKLQTEIEKPKAEYMRAYELSVQCQENIEERMHNAEGLNSFKEREAEAKRNLARAQHEYSKTKDQVSPFAVILQTISECGDDAEKLRAARERITSARKALAQVKESRSRHEEAINKEKVKMHLAHEKMIEQREIIVDYMGKLKEVNGNSIVARNNLNKQYAILDQYLAIQTLKRSKNYPAISTILQSNNPELYESLQQIPDSLPEGSLVISIRNPLTAAILRNVNSEKLQETREQIEKISKTLPAGTDLNNIQDTIALYEISDTDTLESVKKDLKTFRDSAPNGPDCKRLEMKLEYMELQAKAKEISNKINDLTKTLDVKKASQVKTLQQYQAALTTVREQMEASEYSKTMKNLHSLQELQQQEQALSGPQNLANVEQVSQDLSESKLSVATLHSTIGTLYIAFRENLLNERARIVCDKHQLPENVLANDERSDDDGRQ